MWFSKDNTRSNKEVMIQRVLPISSDRDDQNVGKNQNPPKSRGFQQNPGKSLDKKLTFEKTHAESLKT